MLRPHGSLGLIWNIEDYNSPRAHVATTPWLAALQDLNYAIADERGDTEPRFRHLKWREVFDEPTDAIGGADDVRQLFQLPLKEQSTPFSHVLTVERLWDRFATLGHIAVLQGEEREVSLAVTRFYHGRVNVSCAYDRANSSLASRICSARGGLFSIL